MSGSTYATLGGVLVAFAVVVAGCAPPGPADPAGPNDPATPGVMAPAGTAAGSPVLRTATEQDCGAAVPADVQLDEVTIDTEDGVQLRTVILGTGSRGVVLLHQTDNGLCGWLGYGGYLASQGFHVAVFDRRCTFGSSCVPGPAAYNFIGDVEAVTADLRKRGADGTALVGASFGGAVAIGACATLDASACVALSPAQFDNYLGGRVTSNTAIDRIRTPLLVAVAPDDPSSPADTVNALTAQARTGVVTTVSLPAGGAHGWDTLTDPLAPDELTPFSTRLVVFLDQHLP